VKKGLIITLVIIAVLVLGGFFLLAPKPATAALLYIEQGNVEINTGDGWIRAADEMELNKGTQVRTFDGKATVVFHEGEVMQLNPDTHVVLESVRSKEIGVTQLAGETWNKVTKISGITDYTVSTPTTVATVRGTEFYLSPFAVQVTEGEVDYWNKNAAHNKVRVRSGNQAFSDPLREEPMTPEQLAQFQENKQRFVTIMQKVRLREIRKHQKLLDMAYKRGFSEEKLMNQLEAIDQGQKNEDELYHQVPILLRSKAQRTYEITKVIKQAIRDLQ